jgi:hypothetical protein
MARSRKGTGGAGRRRRQRTRADAPGAEAINENGNVGHNSGEGVSRLSADDERHLFLRHRESWNNYQAKLKAAERIGIDVKAALKADGFTVAQMKIADEMTTMKGEARQTQAVRDRLKVAFWIGHAMGRQLSLFEEPDRTPIDDRAYEEGKTAGLEGRTMSTSRFAPGSPANERWITGWHDGQEIITRGGIAAIEGSDAPAAEGAAAS